MPEINNARWTSDHLLKPGGTALYGAQQRERLRQMADEVQALLREYRFDLENMRFDGDKPFQPRIRAFLASRPLAHLEQNLRDAVNNAGKVDKEFQRRYVELPEKREKKAEAKELEKSRQKGVSSARAVNTAAQLQGMALGLEDPVKDSKSGGQEPTFLDFLDHGKQAL
ncbi:hypothetical protein [Streptomyces prunicolor]